MLPMGVHKDADTEAFSSLQNIVVGFLLPLRLAPCTCPQWAHASGSFWAAVLGNIILSQEEFGIVIYISLTPEDMTECCCGCEALVFPSQISARHNSEQ